MKKAEEYYEEWSGKTALENSCIGIHDSADAIDFAQQYSEYVNTKAQAKIKELKAKNKKWDKELDILHRCITEFYEFDNCYEIVKNALDEIDNL